MLWTAPPPARECRICGQRSCEPHRPNTWLRRLSLQREDSSCQLGAVHTWDHFAGLDVSVKETSVCIVDDGGGDPQQGLGRAAKSRFRSLFGEARAAKQTGDSATAHDAYRKLVAPLSAILRFSF